MTKMRLGGAMADMKRMEADVIRAPYKKAAAKALKRPQPKKPVKGGAGKK